MRRIGQGQKCFLALVGAIAAMLVASPASAGGSWLATTEETYQPGEIVTAVGYVASDAVATPLLRATLEAMDLSDAPKWEVSPIYVERTGLDGFLAARVAVRFRIPLEARHGMYLLSVRNEFGGHFSDLIGALIAVGPLSPDQGTLTAEWPLNEPMISQLPPNAIIRGPFPKEVSAAELQAGNYPAESGYAYLPDPSSLRQPEMASVTPVTSPAPVATTSTTTIAPSSKTTSRANSFIELRQPAPVTTAKVVAPPPTSAETEQRESIAATLIPTAVLLVMAILTIGIGVLATRRILRPNILQSESADRFGDLVEERGDRR